MSTPTGRKTGNGRTFSQEEVARIKTFDDFSASGIGLNEDHKERAGDNAIHMSITPGSLAAKKAALYNKCRAVFDQAPGDYKKLMRFYNESLCNSENDEDLCYIHGLVKHSLKCNFGLTRAEVPATPCSPLPLPLPFPTNSLASVTGSE